MFEELNYLFGRTLKEEYRHRIMGVGSNRKGFITRPDFYSENMHINMYLYFNDDYELTGLDGDKCYSYYRGMYNRSSPVYDRNFTKRDIAYLKKYILKVTE